MAHAQYLTFIKMRDFTVPLRQAVASIPHIARLDHDDFGSTFGFLAKIMNVIDSHGFERRTENGHSFGAGCGRKTGSCFSSFCPNTFAR
jgi:hypothetical protein